MRRIIPLCLFLGSLLLCGACQRHDREPTASSDREPPPPDQKLRPAGEGWWCVNSPEALLSCKRTQEGCEGDRGQVVVKGGTNEPPPCEKFDSASCLTWRPRGKGGLRPFCLPTAERCEATRKQLLSNAAERGHTMISGCATWK